MMAILVWLLMVLLLAMTFCGGILVGWWYVHHVSPAAWAMVKDAAHNDDGTGGRSP